MNDELVKQAVAAIGTDEFRMHYERGRAGARLAMFASRMLSAGCKQETADYIASHNLANVKFMDPNEARAHMQMLQGIEDGVLHG